MSKKSVVLSIAVVVFFAGFCCFAAQPTLPDDANYVVAVYDGKELTLGQIKYLQPKLNYDTAVRFVDYWFDVQILSEAAIAEGLDKDPKAVFVAETNHKRELANAYVEKLLSAVTATDEQIKKYYDDNLQTDPQLQTPVYFSFSHITVADANKAETVLKQIQDGGDINELAKQFSEAKDAKNGGRALKYQASTVGSRYGKDVYDALMAAEEGQIIGPIKNKKEQYEIIKHEGKKSSKPKELGDVKDYIKGKLEADSKKEIVDTTLASLREKAKAKCSKVGVLAEQEKPADSSAEQKDKQSD